MGELGYVSWGGTGRGKALRAAVSYAMKAEVDFTYLAILDERSFADIDRKLGSAVAEELRWLLDAQLRLVRRELRCDDLETRVVVRFGPVVDVIEEYVDEAQPVGLAIGAPVTVEGYDAAPLVESLRERLAIPVEIVGA